MHDADGHITIDGFYEWEMSGLLSRLCAQGGIWDEYCDEQHIGDTAHPTQSCSAAACVMSHQRTRQTWTLFRLTRRLT